MRADRFLNLWPKIKPRLRRVALKLVRGKIYIDPKDLLSEGILAIKSCKTTKEKHYNLSYLIQRAKFKMKRYIKIVESLARYDIPHDSCDKFPDLR